MGVVQFGAAVVLACVGDGALSVVVGYGGGRPMVDGLAGVFGVTFPDRQRAAIAESREFGPNVPVRGGSWIADRRFWLDRRKSGHSPLRVCGTVLCNGGFPACHHRGPVCSWVIEIRRMMQE